MEYVSAAQMTEVDKLAMTKFNIGVLQMMEHAGWNMSKLVMPSIRTDSTVHVLAGTGNNGAGGLCAARHLRNKGVDVRVVLSQEYDNGETIWHHLKTLNAMGVPIEFWSGGFPETGPSDVIVDALLGYNIEGDPREPIAGIIRGANETGRPIISLDLPSGLDPDTGEPGDPCIRASATLTLALPKKGFISEAAKEYVGWLYLGDIGLPLELYRELDLDVSYPFHDENIIRI